MFIRLFTTLVLGLTLAACNTPATDKTAAQPTGMVVTANPHATRAGVEVLRSGGSAVDAAVAIEAVLSLVEPQSSGLAGGAFMMHYHAKTGALTAYDGRETAPAATTPDLFLDEEGNSLGYLHAKNSGLSTGVPGVVAMLSLAHSDHGQLPWKDLFGEAETLAENGFEVSPRLHSLLARYGKMLLPATRKDGPLDAHDYFHTPEGEPLPVGHVLKNPDYAQSLRSIAADPRSFYEGDIADAIVAAAQQLPRPGGLTRADMASYQAQRREALCYALEEVQLCGPPPSSSWLAVAQIMGLLEYGGDFAPGGADTLANWARFANAQRLAYADRDQFVADAAMVEVPVKGMLNPSYLKMRAQQLTDDAAVIATPGDPWAYQTPALAAYGRDSTDDAPGTTHFVVVDGAGNVVSMTASVESIFGSSRMAGGMFLNNQLTDFARVPKDEEGVLLANAPAPHKRPRSSMSPTIVLDGEGQFMLASGSPGGNSIIAYVAKSLVGVLNWGLTPQEAINLPNMVGRGKVLRTEKDRVSEEWVEGLRGLGFEVDAGRGENSGLSMVLRHSDGRLEGGVDLRREGVIGVP